MVKETVPENQKNLRVKSSDLEMFTLQIKKKKPIEQFIEGEFEDPWPEIISLIQQTKMIEFEKRFKGGLYLADERYSLLNLFIQIENENPEYVLSVENFRLVLTPSSLEFMISYTLNPESRNPSKITDDILSKGRDFFKDMFLSLLDEEKGTTFLLQPANIIMKFVIKPDKLGLPNNFTYLYPIEKIVSGNAFDVSHIGFTTDEGKTSYDFYLKDFASSPTINISYRSEILLKQYDYDFIRIREDAVNKINSFINLIEGSE